MYKKYVNPFYNPTDTQPRPGDNQNWEDIQRGFYRVNDAISESGSGNGVTMIKVRVVSDGGAVVTQITNIDAVKDVIGKINQYPQCVRVEHLGMAGEYDIYWPVNMMSSGQRTRASFATIDHLSKTVHICDLDTIDGGETWTASVETA